MLSLHSYGFYWIYDIQIAIVSYTLSSAAAFLNTYYHSWPAVTVLNRIAGASGKHGMTKTETEMKKKQKWNKNKNENEHRNELTYTVKKIGSFLLNIHEPFNQNFNQKTKVPND